MEVIMQYKTFQFNDELNEHVILITCTEDLYYLQDDIYDDMSKSNGANFSILVDLILRNGFSFNRYVNMKFCGKDQCKLFIVNPRDVSELIKLRVKNYLIANRELLDNSSLTKNSIKYITEN